MSADLNRLALEMAVDAAWSYIDSESLKENEDGVEWLNVGDDLERLRDCFTLLTGLKLAETHPDHPNWIREIAEL